MSDTLEVKSRLADLQYTIASLRAQLKFRSLMRAATKAGFNQEQPRDERGRWTSEGGVEVTTSDGFLTGIPSIDNTSEALSDILVRVMETLEYLPEMSPSAYGTAVHAAFGLAVQLADLPGVGDIERSFSLEDSDPQYGFPGTVRTDVTLRNVQGDIIAIYDVKTGDAQISRQRADDLREKTRAAENTPVFELNIVRGPSRKSEVVRFRGQGSRMLRRARLIIGRM